MAAAFQPHGDRNVVDDIATFAPAIVAARESIADCPIDYSNPTLIGQKVVKDSQCNDFDREPEAGP